MSHDEPRPTNRGTESARARSVQRRQFLALGAGMGATLLAGCSTDSVPVDGNGLTTTSSSDDDATEGGTFRLLISDQPVAIDDFDELNVSFDRARIFQAGGDGEEEQEEERETEREAENETEIENETEQENETEIEDETELENESEFENETELENETEIENESDVESETEQEDETEEENETEDDESGFYTIDLEGATVDLTQVVGEKAIGVFDGELEAGRYAKIELYAASVEGVVDGESVNVKIPSGKLQIVKPFEVVAGETLTFVFDINVVEKGQTGEYNLLPVISESGVAGRDVQVQEVGDARADGGEDEDEEEKTEAEETESETGETEEAEGEEDEEDEADDEGDEEGPPDDAGGQS